MQIVYIGRRIALRAGQAFGLIFLAFAALFPIALAMVTALTLFAFLVLPYGVASWTAVHTHSLLWSLTAGFAVSYLLSRLIRASANTVLATANKRGAHFTPRLRTSGAKELRGQAPTLLYLLVAVSIALRYDSVFWSSLAGIGVNILVTFVLNNRKKRAGPASATRPTGSAI